MIKSKDKVLSIGKIKYLFHRPDGKKYSGAFFNGKEDGFGKLTSIKGEEKTGEWKEGKRVRWVE
jgi:hypothetical protein